MATLVDTNVWLDVITEDPAWEGWSSTRLAAAADRGPVLINQIVYAELLVRFDTVEDLDDRLRTLSVTRENLPWEAAFLAAKAFDRYRSRGGAKTSPIPDFYIGAHALYAGATLLTRDARRFREYFPGLKLVSPA